MVRVRYTLMSDGSLVSTNALYSAQIGTLRGVISRDPDGRFRATVEVIHGSEWNPVGGATATSRNLTVSKNKIKASLKKLGVQFHDEVRRR